mmetsp:Transcript_54010/g.167414  ORF Transcript_54010/g.167414 Transcript_54010/m.167414 type:complete len:309 (-) Transcript_54010:2880-3806(-)
MRTPCCAPSSPPTHTHTRAGGPPARPPRGPAASHAAVLVAVGQVEAGVAERAVPQLPDLGRVHPVAAHPALDDRAVGAHDARRTVSGHAGCGPVLREDGPPRGDAERQPVAALRAGDAPVVHPRAALRARQHRGRWISWWVPRENPERQVAELGAHFLVDVRRGLQLDERLRALHEVLVVVGGQRDDGVDGLRVEDVLVVRQAQGRLHRLLVLALIELPLRNEVDVEGFAATPRTLQRAVARHALVLGYQRLHSLRRGHCPHCGTGHLHVERFRLVLLDFERGQEVQLLHAIGVLLRSAWHLASYLRE